MWERISCVYVRPRGSFSANFCPMFIAFLQPEIQSAIDQSLPTPAHQRKALGTNESVRDFLLIPGYVLPRGFAYISALSRVDSLLTIGDRHWRKLAAMFEKCMGAYKRDVVVVIKMGAYIHGVLILCGCLLS